MPDHRFGSDPLRPGDPAAQLAAGPPRTGLQWLRLVGNWTNGSTSLGLAVAALGRSRIRRGPRGLVLAERYRLGFPVAGAFTVGNVVITARPDWADYVRAQPTVFAHEEKHTWQWLALGPLFLPAYTAAMGWSWLRTGDRAAANVFEVRAGLRIGGYRDDLPTRPVREGLRSAASLVGRAAGSPIRSLIGSRRGSVSSTPGRTRAGGRSGPAGARSATDATA